MANTNLDQLYNSISQEQSTLQNLLKNEEDEKKSKKYEKDLILISNLLIQLTKYQNYLNKKPNQ
jgi:hypothetical protein